MSQQIAALEKQAGIALLERVGRGVRPTAAGRLLTEHAATISRNLAEAETALAELRAGRTGRLAVRYFGTAGASLVAPAVARLRRRYPGVRIELRQGGAADPLAELSEGSVDLALVIGAPHHPLDGVRLARLRDDAYAAVLPAGHRLADRPVLDLADLAEEPWVSSEPAGPCLVPVLDACAAAGFSPDVQVEGEGYATVLGFVAAGLGVALVPRLALDHNLNTAVVVREVRNPLPVRAVYAAVRESALDHPALRFLLDALKEAAADSS